MKPTSIIFIIISIVLIIAGFVTMGFAGQLGAARGISLVPTDAGGVFEYTFEDDDVMRININVRKANVEIIGSIPDADPFIAADTADTETDSTEDASNETETSAPQKTELTVPAKIELHNFTEGLYKFSCANKVLSVADNYDIGTFSGFLSYAMNFRGFRNYLNYHETSDLEKTIRIYVTDDVKLECTVGEGNVSISKISSGADCTVKIGRGELTVSDTVLSRSEFTGIPNRAALDVSIENGNVNIENGEFDSYTVKFGKTAAGVNTDSGEDGGNKAGLPAYKRSEKLECGKDYSIGEYDVTTSFGKLHIKGNVSLECQMDIKYDDDDTGIKSAVPNAAQTRFTVTENGGSYVVISLTSRYADTANAPITPPHTVTE